MFNSYTPEDWYWRISEDGRIYSTAARGFVASVPDPDKETRIGTLSELEDVLEAQAPDSLPPRRAKAASRRRELIRDEADRRIGIAVSARSKEHLQEILSTAALTAAFLLRKRQQGLALAPRELQAEFVYNTAFDFIRRVRNAQGELEASLPDDFREDRYWPS